MTRFPPSSLMPRSAGPLLARLAAIALAAGAIGACSEKTESTAACATLCPEEALTVKDTTLDVVTLDSTLIPFPTRGTETSLLVANRGADLDTRAVVRFDNLVTKFDRSTTETGVPITSLTTARLKFSVDTAASSFGGPFTVSAYDVDTQASDQDDAAVLALFTSARLLGSVTVTSKADVKDSLVIPLNTAAVAAKIVAGAHLRVGIQVTGSAGSPTRLMLTAQAGSATDPTLAYDPTDTTDAIKAFVIAPSSSTPADAPTAAAYLGDYTIVATAPRAIGADELGVGGLPSRRAFVRLAIPRAILDSTTIVRATLVLTQRPSPGLDPNDSISVQSGVVVASADVTDIRQLTDLASPGFVGSGASFTMPTVKLKPSASGEVGIQIPALLRYYWRGRIVGDAARAIVLRIENEGTTAGEVRFWSSDAANPALRPHLRLTYIPTTEFGVP